LKATVFQHFVALMTDFSPAAMHEPVVAVAVCSSTYNKALADVGGCTGRTGVNMQHETLATSRQEHFIRFSDQVM